MAHLCVSLLIRLTHSESVIPNIQLIDGNECISLKAEGEKSARLVCDQWASFHLSVN